MSRHRKFLNTNAIKRENRHRSNHPSNPDWAPEEWPSNLCVGCFHEEDMHAPGRCFDHTGDGHPCDCKEFL